MNNDIITCRFCGSEIDTSNEPLFTIWSGGHACNDCVHGRHIEDIEYCNCTGCYELKENCVGIYDEDNCELFKAPKTFAEINYVWSDYCQRYYKYTTCGRRTRDHGFVSWATLGDDFFICEECDEYIHNDDRCEDGDDLCIRCYENRQARELIYGYHQFNSWRLYKTSNEKDITPPWYIGFELEIDNDRSYNVREVHDLITSYINGVLMHDGSLSRYGIEIVSHPQTYNYIIEQESKYRELFDKLTNDYNFTSHENGRCGLHFHVTRPSEEVINRCELIIENFRDELFKFSRRDGTRWCNFMIDKEWGNQKKKEVTSISYIEKHKYDNDRYMALNLTNDKTIEFRFCRGTLKYDTFRACVDLIQSIMIHASDLSIDLTTLQWDDFMTTDYLKRYCEQRDIKSQKKIIDNTALIIARDTALKDYKEKYNEILKCYVKKLVIEYNKSNTKISMTLSVDDTTQALSEKYNQLAYIVDDIKRIKNFINYTFNEAEDYVNALQNTTQRVHNKYYKNRLNKIVKEAEKVCVLL